ncbi:MAG: acyltransferase family protein [Mycobacteriales bacterium]
MSAPWGVAVSWWYVEIRGAGGRLPTLTGLRFVAAAMVLGFHLRNRGIFLQPALSRWVERIFGLGLTGVSFFFILSGFVLTWSGRPERATAFWRRRIARVYPNHLATAVMIAAVGLAMNFVAALSVGVVVANLTLVHAWIADPTWYFSLNSPSWSLSCEAFFYLSFPLAYRVLNRLPGRALLPAAALLLAGIWLVPAVVLAVAPAQSATTWWVIAYFPPTRWLEFLLGIVLALAVRAGRFPPVPLPVAALVTVACYVWAGRSLPWPLPIVAGTAPGFALLVPAAALADLRGRRTACGSRPMVRLGEMSFALYLVQRTVDSGGHMLLRNSGHEKLHCAASLMYVAAVVAVSLALAWLLHRFVEVPAYRALTRERTGGPRPPARSHLQCVPTTPA